MNVLGICGSARKDGNSAILVREVLSELEKEGIGVTLVELAELDIAPCRACFACAKTGFCAFRNDDFDDVFNKMLSAQGIVLGSPVYSANVSAKMQALLERAAVLADMKPGRFRFKVGAAVASARRGGVMSALDTMNHFFLNHEAVVAGSTYWNMAYGIQPGDVRNDTEGMATMRNLGRNMAHLLQRLHG